MTAVSVFAPAKVNLTLHVTGRRDDGYHLLDSLVAFAPVGDLIVIHPGNTLSLTVEGPEAKGVPADMKNLALRAAALSSRGEGVALTLTKYLPAASGIGGGSSDAAAAFRGMLAYGEPGAATMDTAWAMPDVVLETEARALLDLGADVPMCLLPKPLRARGIGEKITFVDLPPLPAVLVNPRVPVPTADVFRGLQERESAPMPDVLPEMPTTSEAIGFLETCRNDLEAPARAVAPEIGDAIEGIAATKGCGLARMSGSGATCFGLYEEVEDAQAAFATLKAAHPDWWVAGGLLGDQSGRAMPKVS